MPLNFGMGMESQYYDENNQYDMLLQQNQREKNNVILDFKSPKF